MSGIKTDVCHCWCHAVAVCTHSNTINSSGSAVREPLLLCCGPFLRSSTSMRGESSSQRQTDQSGLVWIRSGAHGWGLCTAQLQHKWIFTWLCYPFSFLPNQVSRSRVELCDRNEEFCCEWHALLNVFYAPQFAPCARACQILLVESLDCSIVFFFITCSF